MSSTTHRSAVFAFANDVVEHDAASDPIFATGAGVTSYDHLLPDFSPERTVRDIEATKDFLSQLSTLEASDDVDRVALAVLRERLDARLGLLESGESSRIFGVLTSPLSEIRQVFELMPSEGPAQVAVVAQRLAQVRPALTSWRRTLEQLAEDGQLPSRRHVMGVGQQAATYAEGTYEGFARRLAPESTDDSDLVVAARDADAACGELATWMVEVLALSAGDHEACGPERYAAWSQYWNGAVLDFEELYAWGFDDLQRINARMWEIAQQLLPGATSLAEVAAHLEADPARLIEGTDELLRRLIGFTEDAVAKLDGVHFDIDPRIRFCDARLAPEGGAAAPYYIPPSEDLSRPGTTWFPTLGATTFSWWSHASTWYHEGVPGHHLQCATSIIEADRQSRFHRLEAWTSGYGEGWALYAERLMNELGFFEDLGDEMGFLAGQALRAARIVVDIGLHLELPVPAGFGSLADFGDCSGKAWTPPMAVAVLEERAIQPHEMSVSEVDRVWMRTREAARFRLGEDFSLKRFHAFALALGPMGLDPLEAELAAWDGS